MALYELRQYKVRNGNMPAWLDLMEGEIIPYVVSKGMVFNASFAAEDDPTVYMATAFRGRSRSCSPLRRGLRE